MELTDLMEMGALVFPIEAGGKKPLISGWQRQSTDAPWMLDRWRGEYGEGINFGIDCGASGWIVVDVDNKGEKRGDDTVLALELAGKSLPPTLTVRTPTGGYHYIYRGAGRNTAGKLGDGIDTRGAGGYIVALGGRVGGGRYEIAEHHEIADAPEWVVQGIGAPRERDERAQQSLVDWDLPENVARARERLARMEPPAEGERNTATYRAACMLRDYGVAKQTALAMLMEEGGWNDRCAPPLDQEELEHVTDSAFRYASLPAGTAVPEVAFPDDMPDIPEDEEEEDDGPRPLSFYDEPPAPRPFLIEGWIPEGELTLLTGEGGTGKSLSAMELTWAAVTNTPYLGLPVTEKERVVVYIGCEDDDYEFRIRWHNHINHIAYTDICKAARNLDDHYFYWPRVGKEAALARVKDWELVQTKFFVKLKAFLSGVRAKNPDAQIVVVLDTVADVYAGDENTRAMVTQFAKQCLGSIKSKFGATMIVIGHPPKNKTDKFSTRGSQYSGSTAWDGSFRSRIFLGKIPGAPENYRQLQHVKANYAAIQKPITVKYDNGVYLACSSSEDIFADADSKVRILVYNTIREHAHADNPVSASPKAKKALALKKVRILDPDTRKVLEWAVVERAVGQLIADGQVEEVEDPDRGKVLFPCGGGEM